MQPFTKHTGLVVPLDRVNVDTDQMVPKQFLKLLTARVWARFLFYDWRYLPGEKPNPEFVLNLPRYKGASVLLARANFGCGSSREHAPWGVLDYGFRVVIAPSYADIFYNNCFKNGILPATLPEAQIDELFRRTETQEGYKLTVDLPNQTITDKHGLMFRFDIAPSRKEVLLKGLDDIGTTLKHESDITAYEKTHTATATMFEPVDIKITPTANNDFHSSGREPHAGSAVGSGDSGAAGGPSSSAIRIPANTNAAPSKARWLSLSCNKMYEVTEANTGSSVKRIAAWLELVNCCAHS